MEEHTLTAPRALRGADESVFPGGEIVLRLQVEEFEFFGLLGALHRAGLHLVEFDGGGGEADACDAGVQACGYYGFEQPWVRRGGRGAGSAAAGVAPRDEPGGEESRGEVLAKRRNVTYSGIRNEVLGKKKKARFNI